MKLAISLPDPLFLAVDRAARSQGLPRSQFFARAAVAFLRQIEQHDVTARLDEVYGTPAATEPDAFAAAAARASLSASEWK